MAAGAEHVAHVVGPSRGGMRRHVRYLAEHPPAGYETLGVWGPADLGSYFDTVPFHAVERVPLIRPPKEAAVVHAHGFEAGLVALRRRRPPVVMTAHIDLVSQGRTAGSATLRALVRLTARRADALIAVSETAGRHFSGARVIPPAFEPLPAPRRSRSEVRAELGTPDDRVVVVSVGRLHPDKGLDVFIGAVARTGAEGWICGDGPLRGRLERLASGTSVRLLGHRDDIADILGAADVFALPSVGEAYGIAVVEAIGAGLPVVVSSAGAMSEIAGDAGLVVAPGDRTGFARAVERVAGDPALRASLGARARGAPKPDPDELVGRIGAVYDEVTA
ncbi:MAG: glycosyltransferase family 4 protein [Actinomycetota bacterium]